MIYKANKVSGSETTLFAVSALGEVVKQNNQRNGINFPFYAITVDLEKHKYDEWIREAEFDQASDLILKKVGQEGLGYFENIREISTKESDEIFAECKKIYPKMKALEDAELATAYEDFMDKYLYFYGIGAITFIYESVLSDKLTKSIDKRIPDSSHLVGQLLNSGYKSFMLESDELLLNIKNSDGQEKEGLISRYLDQFFFMLTNYRHAPILTRETVTELSSQVHENSQKETDLAALSKISETLTKEEKDIIELFKITEPIRDKRKRTNVIGSFMMFRFLEELERRKNIEREIAEKIYWFEFSDLMNGATEFIEQIKSRKIISIIVEGEQVQYVDDQVIEEEALIDREAQEIRGMIACKGKITGKVKIVFGHSDFGKITPGDILVTEMTRPDFMPVLKNATAIITDEGGLTCHAAIVAREMNKPCIIGTKNATKVLKDGDEVEVDADNGIVRKI